MNSRDFLIVAGDDWLQFEMEKVNSRNINNFDLERYIIYNRSLIISDLILTDFNDILQSCRFTCNYNDNML